MPTQTYYFSGEVVFPHLFKPDTKFDAAGIYHISMILDDASASSYTDSGIQVTPKAPKTNPTGPKSVRFSRKTQQIMKNELVKFGPPVVLGPDDQPLKVLPGNGSKATVKVNVFDTMRGKGHRLEAVKFSEVIEYKPEPKPEAAAAAAPKAAPGVIPF